MLILSMSGCAQKPIDDKDHKLIVPLVQKYTPAQYEQAQKEHEILCVKGDKNPAVCKLIEDFGKMRDSARVALGLEIPVNN